ncbi:hypothetical protein BDB01DRAFT_778467 [Pilobolus umbonatus]|nr:hypothetical protein BDB01DRAFT_778467 [Pilobolus umbonatus]
MSKVTTLDSDLSLLLSDTSSLSSDSELSKVRTSNNKKQRIAKKKKKKSPTKKTSINTRKDSSLYCICRRGYDGKEFMIECDQCQEWFHGSCIGLKPNTSIDHYFCDDCLIASQARKKNKKNKNDRRPSPVKKITLEPPKPTLPTPTDNSDEDLDDICPVCDTECTCGTLEIKEEESPKKSDTRISTKINDPGWTVKDVDQDVVERVGVEHIKKSGKEPVSSPKRGKSTTLLATIIHQKNATYLSSNYSDVSDISEVEEDVIIDDLDDLLETMSALSANSSKTSFNENEVFFSDDEQPIEDSNSYSSVAHIDSDEDIEIAETRAIIDEMEVEEEEEEEDEEESDDNAVYVEDEEEDEEEEEEVRMNEYYFKNDHQWSSSDEEDEEFDYSSYQVEDTDHHPSYSYIHKEDCIPFMQPALKHDIKEDTNDEDKEEKELLMPFELDTFHDLHLPSVHNRNSDTDYSIDSSSSYMDLFHSIKNPSPHMPEESDNKGKKRQLSEEEEEIIPVSMDELVDTSQLYTSRSPSPEDDPYLKDLSRWQRIPIGAFRLMRSKNKLWLER